MDVGATCFSHSESQSIVIHCRVSLFHIFLLSSIGWREEGGGRSEEGGRGRHLSPHHTNRRPLIYANFPQSKLNISARFFQKVDRADAGQLDGCSIDSHHFTNIIIIIVIIVIIWDA